MSDERVDPRILQLKLLSDMNKKLESLDALTTEVQELKRLTKSTIEDGIIEPINRTVTTSMLVVHPPYPNKPWFGVKITNDDTTNSVYVIVNTEKSSKQVEIKAGETRGVDFRTAIIEDILLHTESGSANVRIVGVR